MEHKVYVCGWRQTSAGFNLWLKSKPTICAKGSNYISAECELLQAIRDDNGAMHAVLEFDPPLPSTKRESKYSEPELYLICGDDRFETDCPKARAFESFEERERRFKWVDDFFQTPVCRTCATSSGERSQRPLELNYVPNRLDGAFGYVGREAGTMIEIVSEDFLRLLTDVERVRLEFREVLRKGKGRKFYEILGPAGPPFVGVTSLAASGWRCADCNHRHWSYPFPGLSSFVAANALPANLPEVFTVGTLPEISLCVTGRRWREIVGKQGTRGFTSRALGVVPDNEVLSAPELPLREKGRDEILRAELSQ